MIGQFNKVWDEEGKARSFEKLGHTVVRINESSFSEENIQAIIQLHPDLVLFAKLKVHQALAEQLMAACKAHRIKTASWHPDLYVGLAREHYLKIKPHFQANFVFSPDGGHDTFFKELGINHKVIRQGIFDEDCFIGNTVKPHDIVFIGTDNPLWPYRAKLAGFLWLTYGSKFTWYGRGDSDEIRGKDLNNVIASSKIIIGDSVDSPFYWSNRIYETIGRGGFIIHPDIQGMDSEYEKYKHYVPYKYGDFEGLKEKIDYFLQNDQERRQIAMAGMLHTKENHTLLNRCKQLLQFI